MFLNRPVLFLNRSGLMEAVVWITMSISWTSASQGVSRSVHSEYCTCTALFFTPRPDRLESNSRAHVVRAYLFRSVCRAGKHPRRLARVLGGGRRDGANAPLLLASGDTAVGFDGRRASSYGHRRHPQRPSTMRMGPPAVSARLPCSPSTRWPPAPLPDPRVWEQFRRCRRGCGKAV